MSFYKLTNNIFYSVEKKSEQDHWEYRSVHWKIGIARWCYLLQAFIFISRESSDLSDIAINPAFKKIYGNSWSIWVMFLTQHHLKVFKVHMIFWHWQRYTGPLAELIIHNEKYLSLDWSDLSKTNGLGITWVGLYAVREPKQLLNSFRASQSPLMPLSECFIDILHWY